jgi:hypothetical protein
MSFFSKAVLFSAALTLMACSRGQAQEWEPLVKGDTLDGWTQRGGNAKYTVKDGVITGETAPGQKKNAFLCTNKSYHNFDLELEFKVDPKLNSGVQIRSHSDPNYKDGVVHGYQVEIDPSPRSWTAGIYDESRRGWLQDLKNNPAAQKAFRQGDWNHLWISCRGDNIRTKLNGVDAANLNDSMTSSGFIALQVHGTTSTVPMQVQFRNIRLQDWDKVAITKWESSSPFGDYQGQLTGGAPIVAQVIDLGGGDYQAKFLHKFEDTHNVLAEVKGRAVPDGPVRFESDKISGELRADEFKGKKADGTMFSLKPVKRESPTMAAPPPEGAIVLFDGKNLDAWQKDNGQPIGWKIAENGAMQIVPNTGTIETKQNFADMDLHLEFRTPLMPYARGQQRANSGVYIQGSYEVQVLDSYGLEGLDNECGGIYKVGAPKVNMAFPPLQWQTYDIHFQAAKWDGDKKTSNARITVKHNGVVVQDNIEIPGPTGGAKYKGEPNHPGPIMLQDHHNEIQYRNIRVKPGA